MAGIAVIASNTDGQKEVHRQAACAVKIFESNNADSLASTINNLLSDKEKLQKAKKKALEIAINRFCWEKQEKWLVKWVSEL